MENQRRDDLSAQHTQTSSHEDGVQGEHQLRYGSVSGEMFGRTSRMKVVNWILLMNHPLWSSARSDVDRSVAHTLPSRHINLQVWCVKCHRRLTLSFVCSSSNIWTFNTFTSKTWFAVLIASNGEKRSKVCLRGRECLHRWS